MRTRTLGVRASCRKLAWSTCAISGEASALHWAPLILPVKFAGTDRPTGKAGASPPRWPANPRRRRSLPTPAPVAGHGLTSIHHHRHVVELSEGALELIDRHRAEHAVVRIVEGHRPRGCVDADQRHRMFDQRIPNRTP